MSRDFIASQAGREFKRSPNRDRVTRGSPPRLSGILYEAFYQVILPFRNPAPSSANADFTSSNYYTALRSTVEIIVAGQPYTGAKTIEEWSYNASSNRLERTYFQRDANWQTISLPFPFPTQPAYNSPTMSITTNSIYRRTIELLGTPGDIETLYDQFYAELTSLGEFPDSGSNTLIASSMWRKNVTNGGQIFRQPDTTTVLIGSAMPSMVGFSFQDSPIELTLPTAIRIPVFNGKRIRLSGKSGLKWVLLANQQSGLSGYPAAGITTEISCERDPEEPAGRIYDPELKRAKENSGKLVFTLLFGPLAWTQMVDAFPPLPPINIGPSSAGYDKPTCYPDL